MKNLNLSMPIALTLRGRKVRFENKETGLKIYQNQEGLLEVLANGSNLTLPNGELEFVGCTVYHLGLVLDTLSGKKAVFLFNEEIFFKAPDSSFEFHKAFLLGGIFVSTTGRVIKEYAVWMLKTPVAA